MNAPQRPAGHKAPTVVILRGRSLPPKNPLTGSCCHFMRERRPSQCSSEWPRPLALRGCFPFGSSGLRLTDYAPLNMTPECFRNTTSSLVILRGRSLPPKNPPTAQNSPTARARRPLPLDMLRAAPYRHGQAGLTQSGDVSACSALLNMTPQFVILSGVRDSSCHPERSAAESKGLLPASGSPTARARRPLPFDRLRAARYRHGRAGATRLGDVSLHFVALNMTTVLFRELRGAGSRKAGGS
jgi:hypothetical protein